MCSDLINNTTIMKKILCILFYTLFPILSVTAQITTNCGSSYSTANQLLDVMIGSGISYSSASLTSFSCSGAYFDGISNIGFDSGILLATGTTPSAEPGNNSAVSSFFDTDPDVQILLSEMNSSSSFLSNLIVLEFDFEAATTDFEFDYVFASNEFPINTCGDDVDVFGFLLSGPGISGPYSSSAMNIALVPNVSNPSTFTNTSVSINSINSGVENVGSATYCDNMMLNWSDNSIFYVTNENMETVNYPGFTVPLKASAFIVSSTTYHMKIVLVDVGDSNNSSAVFFEENSFNSVLEGCTQENAFNYDSTAIVDDGSCYPIIYGCMDVGAYNFVASTGDVNIDVNTSDAIEGSEGSCIAKIFGCIDILFTNYDSTANTDNGTCDTFVVYGCTSPGYFGYNPDANVEDGSCEEFSYGCTEISACNYDSSVNADDASCTYAAENLDCDGVCLNDADGDGVCAEDEINAECGDSEACDYLELDVTTDINNDLCTYPAAVNVDCEGLCLTDTDGDGVCDEDEIVGCTDLEACNYNALATDTDNFLCAYAAEPYLNCDGLCLDDTDGDGVCDQLEIAGCQNDAYENYDASATDPGECWSSCLCECGGPDPLNICLYWDMDGICDCIQIVGCQDAMACNYDELAIEPGTCDFAVTYFDCDGICLDDTDGDGVCDQFEITGCTDLTALNYNPVATENDLSCIYLSDCDCCGGGFYFDPNPNPYCEEHCASMIPLCFEGCLDPIAINYSLDATEAPISCIYNICSDPNYLEYYFNPTEIDFENENTEEICSTPITSTGLTADMFTDPINTGANMTLPMPGGLLDQFAGGQIAAFMGDICVGLESITTGFIAMGLWGDDSSTELLDGLLADEVPTFAVLYNGGVISLDQIELTGYQTNGLVSIANFQFTEPIGCTDPEACNYLSYALIDDGSCYFADLYYNCEGVCINDTDNDGICDELEIPGCTVWGYNNYNDLATDDDNSCTVSWEEDYAILSLSSTITLDSIQSAYNLLDSLPISIDLLLGWNIIGYTNSYEHDAVEALEAIEDLIVVFKDNNADVYLPEYGFNGIGNLLPGHGYQIKVSEAYDAFSFENTPTFGCTYVNTSNYNPNALIDDNSCIFLGCIDSLASNYVNYANQDDGTCIYLGCTSEWADNFDVIAVIDDASCYRVGCTFNWADNYDYYATDNDGSCIRLGCTNFDSDNYDTQATSDDGSCYRAGCMSDWADNYDVLATIDNASCYRYGCMNPDADNFDPLATINNNSCVFSPSIDDWEFQPVMTDNNMSVIFPDGILIDFVGGELQVFIEGEPIGYSTGLVDESGVTGVGVMGIDNICNCDYASPGDELTFAILMNDETIVNVDVSPPVTYYVNGFDLLSSESLTFTVEEGCIHPDGCNYVALPSSVSVLSSYCTFADLNLDCDGNCLNDADGDLICDEYEIAGCQNTLSCSYNYMATDDDGSCIFPSETYLDCNEQCFSDIDNDGICDILEILGCQDDAYANFNPLATDTHTCIGLLGCTDETAYNYAPNVTVDDGSCIPIIYGCMNPTNYNYNPQANTNDGSCEY